MRSIFPVAVRPSKAPARAAGTCTDPLRNERVPRFGQRERGEPIYRLWNLAIEVLDSIRAWRIQESHTSKPEVCLCNDDG
jgi:hypothetical protein